MKNLRLKAARAARSTFPSRSWPERVGASPARPSTPVEKGDYNPTINLCLKICHALGKTLDDLFWEPVGAAVPPASAVRLEVDADPPHKQGAGLLRFVSNGALVREADGGRPTSRGRPPAAVFLGTGRVPGFMSPLCRGMSFFKNAFFG